MIQEYLNRAIDLYKKKPISYIQLTCWLNEDRSNILIKDITKIDFNSLYPNILVKLFDLGHIPQSEAESINKIRYVIENRMTDKQLWLDNKVFVNSYFGKIHSREPKVTHLVTGYMNSFFNSLLVDFIDSIVYVDTDSLFITDRVDEIIEKVRQLDLPFESNVIDYFFIKSKKRYIYSDEYGFLQIKGFSQSNYLLKEKIVNEIKTMIREDKLESIGI